MEQDWQDLKEPWERVIWARKKWFMKTIGSTGSKEAAAESLGMKRSTYAAYERSPDTSRTAKLDQEHAIHFGRKFGVNWVWLLSMIDQPPPIIGQASVIDGDTIEIHGIRIRLNGIDAPESRQLCQTNQGQNYRCGQQSALYLADLISNHTITCNPTGSDRYQRTIAKCYIGSIDIQARMVETGHALAFVRYSREYTLQENIAHSASLGVWQGAFELPWEWRKSH